MTVFFGGMGLRTGFTANKCRDSFSFSGTFFAPVRAPAHTQKKGGGGGVWLVYRQDVRVGV